MKNISINNFLNSRKEDNSLNSFLDDFTNLIKDYLNKKASEEKALKLPIMKILTYAKEDGNFLECFDSVTQKIYYISKDNVIGDMPNPGDVLKFNENRKLYVDETGISINEDEIEAFLKSCTIEK